MHVFIQERKHISVHLEKQAYIRALLFKTAPTEVSAKYSNYSNVFSTKNETILSNNFNMNEYAIKLKEDKQPLFKLIYSLGPIELEILKTYIKMNLVSSFIHPSKLPAEAFIFFNHKLNYSLYFSVDY